MEMIVLLTFGLGPLVVIVPIIFIVIIVVLSAFGIGGINFVLSGDKPTLEGEREIARQRGIYRPDLFGESDAPVVIENALNVQLLRKFKTRLADIAAGKGNTAQAKAELKSMGISTGYALKNPEEALKTVLAFLLQMKTTVGKSSVATSIFGSVLSSKLMNEWNKNP